MFRVQESRCETCIFKKDSPLNLKKLLNEIRDPNFKGHFNSYRRCHHSDDACCNGFWTAHKDDFDAGQIAQRLGVVQFVNDDILG